MDEPEATAGTSFTQEPPRLGNQYADDRVLRSLLARALPEGVLGEIEPELEELGALAGGELHRQQLAERHVEPRLVRWDAWGERVDRVELTPLWRRARGLAARRGLVATAYERRHGAFSRLHQMALVYLFTPATDMFSCPLAMTDGAAAVLSGPVPEAVRPIAGRALGRLTSRDPGELWTSGQWMTETTGGSDVSASETVARRDGDGWRLYGRKWFTSAVTSEMALTLARPEGAAAGAGPLALFYVETTGAVGRTIRVERLKDKLGTRKLPTAELLLDGLPAVPLHPPEEGGGVRAIAPMLNVTRLWNALTAVSLMRRGIALATDYARRRRAFGAPLAELPLHADTLAGLEAAYAGAFHLSFRVAELLGRTEAGEASAGEARLLRLLTPIAKLVTARQAVAATSEVLEAFGGAGYVEDTGVPVLLRDAQVLSIWEGTTNVLALDLLRALDEASGPTGGFARLTAEVERCRAAAREPTLAAATARAAAVLAAAGAWLAGASSGGRPALEAGARRFALAVGMALEVALLCHHAQWELDHPTFGGAALHAAAARRLAATDLSAPPGVDRRDTEVLAPGWAPAAAG